MQINNKTPFAVQTALLLNEEGLDTLYTVVKASFKIGKRWTLSDKQTPPQAEDQYWDNPATSSLRYSTDFHTGKAATDIIVPGNACELDFKPVHELDVSVTVGTRQKILRVSGDRIWRNGLITPPEKFNTLALIYENAFGGRYSAEGELKSLEARNPVGKGYQGERAAAEMEGQPLPNIEDPQQLIQTTSDTPEPAVFGFIAPHWEPRASSGGTCDEHWQQNRAPFLPADYDKCFQNVAHPDLVCEDFLRGGETVEITHMHPKGTLRFSIPTIRLGGQIRISQQKAQPLKFDMETVIIKPGKLQLQMVWKAAHICHNDALNIKSVDLSLSR